CQTHRVNQPTGKRRKPAEPPTAIAVAKTPIFTGSAAAASASARTACMKTSGACPVTGLPGIVRIVGIKMAWATS
ncbi:MAG: hypothetical protein, partial [Olavius algarvensis Delta 4 endosymbiont]